MARVSLTKKFIDNLYHESYLELNFSNVVGSVVDGTDVNLETVHSDRYVNVIINSNKIHALGVRGITWSTPMGLVHEFTDPFLPRASKKVSITLCASQGRFKDLPPGYIISGDEGFQDLFPKVKVH